MARPRYPLRIRFLPPDPHQPDWNELPVLVQVIDQKYRLVAHEMIRGKLDLDLYAGRYSIQAALPSGDSVTASARLGNDHPEATVTLRFPNSPNEYLAVSQYLGASRKHYGSKETRPDMWAALWKYDGQVWQVHQDSNWGYSIFSDDTPERKLQYNVAMRIPGETERTRRLCAIQLGGSKVPWRIIMLPPTMRDILLNIRPARAANQLNGGVVVKIFSEEWRVESFSHFAEYGAYNALTAMEKEMLQEAEALFFNKMGSPYGAMIAGYYLLKVGKLSLLHDWTGNFDRRFDWLPDSAVINGWFLLRQRKQSTRDQARNRFLEAVTRGVPVMTEGLRLLVDGLEYLRDEAKERGTNDVELENALKAISGHASACDVHQRMTTFGGITPDEPVFTRPTGAPAPHVLTYVHHIPPG